MEFLKSTLDVFLFVFLAVGGYLLLGFREAPLVFLSKPVLLHLSYYSIALVDLVFLFVFGTGAYLYLLTGGRREEKSMRSLAGTLYLFASFVVILGVFKGLVEIGQSFYYEAIWLSYALLWGMFNCWFWLQRVVERPRLRLIYSAVYGLVIVLHFPIFLTAFSYHLEIPPPVGLGTDNMLLLAFTLCFFTLFFLRVYLKFKSELLPHHSRKF